MTDKTTSTRPMPAIGKWRAAGALRDGWQIMKLGEHERTGTEVWITVTRAMQITSPLRIVRLTMKDGTSCGYPADRESGIEFFTRTPSEQLRAEEAKEKAK